MERFLIIDGDNLACRAYYAGNIFSFFSMIMQVVDNLTPHGCAFAFGNGEQSWRHKAFPAYKADRDETPDALVAWLVNLVDALKLSGLAVFEGPEADDIVKSLTFVESYDEHESGPSLYYTLSSDQDMYALSDINNTIISFAGSFVDRINMTPEDVFQKLGVRPGQIADYKALVGGHDNIPGIPRIGKKSAATLLQLFDNIEGIYEYIDDLDSDTLVLRNKKNIKAGLLKHQDDIKFWQELCQLTAPALEGNPKIEDCLVPNREIVSGIIQNLRKRGFGDE